MTTAAEHAATRRTGLQVNLFFNGNAEDVLAHYAAALGGSPEIIRFEGTPAGEHASPDWKNKVLYGSLISPLGAINAMDAPPGRGPSAPGENFAICVYTETEAQTDTVFARLLAGGGTVTMPLEKTFWAAKFGMLTDKFGIKWMVSLQADSAK